MIDANDDVTLLPSEGGNPMRCDDGSVVRPGSAVLVNASADELTVKPSKHTVKETVDRLTSALKEKGITVAARISIMPREPKPQAWRCDRRSCPVRQPEARHALDADQPADRDRPADASAGLGATRRERCRSAMRRPSALKSRYKLDGRDESPQDDGRRPRGVQRLPPRTSCAHHGGSTQIL